MIKAFYTFLVVLLTASLGRAQTSTVPPLGRRVAYDLTIADTTVAYTGHRRPAIAINGLIPGPTLTFTEGDTAVIRVHNHLAGTTSLHWHGILIPNQYDGVPGLSTFPIEAGKTLDVVFPVKQSGTYWYHSHTHTQEQIGLTGSIVIHKRMPRTLPEEVLVLNDWTDTRPSEVWRQLKRGTEWYAIRKLSTQSYGQALRKGAFGEKLYQEWRRMPAMDISDVKYNQFHVNGAETVNLSQYHAGDSVKLRIVNASASSYFWLQFAGGPMQVIAADGQDVKPVAVDKFLIATAETYDVVIRLPEGGQYELRATAQDVSGHTSAFFGSGSLHPATDFPRVDYFKIMKQMNGMMRGMHMKMGMSKGPMTNVETASGTAQNPMPMAGMQIDGMSGQKDSGMVMHRDMNASGMAMDGMQMDGMAMDGMMTMPRYGFDYPPGTDTTGVLSYKQLHALNNDIVPKPTGQPDRVITLSATGNMFRYVWSFNNTVLTEADKILIKKGEHVRVIFHNTTMMEHPLHLHGHFFRLRNGRAMDDAPLKHTFNILPMATDTIDFEADDVGDWFFHCHTLYHMLSGMARTFHYADAAPPVQVQQPASYRHFLREHGRHTFLWGNVDALSQGAFANFTIANTRWEINGDAEWDWRNRYESEVSFRKFLDKRQFLAVFAGTDNRRERMDATDAAGNPMLQERHLATAGLTYFLPLLITAEGRVDHKGHLRLQLSRQGLPLTRRAGLDFMVNTDKEYTIALGYRLARNLAVKGSYDSDYGWGAGLSFIY